MTDRQDIQTDNGPIAQGEPFYKRTPKNGSPYAVRPLSVCLSCLSVCDVRVLWPNGWTDQDETWHAGRPRPWPHCVRWGPSSPFQRGPQPPPPNFRPISVVAKWLNGSRCHLVWRKDSVQILLDGDPAPLPKKVRSPLHSFRPTPLVAKRQDGSK